MLFLENFSMIVTNFEKGEEGVWKTRYSSLFASGCSNNKPNGLMGNWNNDYVTKFLASRYVWVQKDTNIEKATKKKKLHRI